MTKEELAESLGKILYKANCKVIKSVVDAIDDVLKDETSRTDLEKINWHYPSGRIKKALAEALKKSRELMDTSFVYAAAEEHDAMVVAGGILLAEKLSKSSVNYSEATATMVMRAKENAEREITLALTKPVFVDVGPALTRFESPTHYYNRVVTQAISDVKNGRVSRQKAVSDACRTLTRSGMRYVNYQSGHTNRIDVAVSRALQSELTHLQGDFAFENAAILGTDLFEVDAHSGARPTHQVWQGKVYTMEELETICGLGDILGLKGVNCHHQFKPYIKGSKRAWTDAELAKMHAEDNRLKTFGGKEYTTYQARQKQRQMEASMRIQRERIALDPYIDQEKAKAKYSAMRMNYKAFSRAMGEKTHFDRVYTGTI